MKTHPIPSYDGPLADLAAPSREAIAAFLKERDENVAPGEADDTERLESARCILALRPAVVGEGEPVAWRYRRKHGLRGERWTVCEREPHIRDTHDVQPLYTTPASQDALIARDGCEMPEVAMARYIEILRSDEGDSVTICCDDPEATTREKQVAIDCRASWTDWNERRFYGESVLQCLAKAVQARALLADLNAGAGTAMNIAVMGKNGEWNVVSETVQVPVSKTEGEA